ncbi:MAG: CDP-glucose 4,6-dehydratase [Pseudomonadota bacterium]
MTLFRDIYRNRRVLLTGHTGFKGSWLALWLNELGASTVGVALPPETTPNHWNLLKLSINGHLQDIRDAVALAQLVNAVQPEIVFHLAAQPLVGRSYELPLDTWSTNVMGTANLLESCRQCPSVKAIVVVTTDKCYENQEQPKGYRETDRLGGRDPYSASKAAAELVAASYRQAFFHQSHIPLLATARAGNVIGGGDWSEDRLIPDLVRAMQAGQPLEVRSPNATRPWQHVLESLSGYLMLGQKLLEGKEEFATAWNFGSDQEGNRTVESVLNSLKSEWPMLSWRQTARPQQHEATLLQLDSTKARQQLGWQPVWSLDEGLSATAQWYRAYQQGKVISHQQLHGYIAQAQVTHRGWILG